MLPGILRRLASTCQSVARHRLLLPISLLHHPWRLPARLPADPNSGGSSFSILLGAAPHLDMQYTVFGEVTEGLETLAALEEVRCAGCMHCVLHVAACMHANTCCNACRRLALLLLVLVGTRNHGSYFYHAHAGPCACMFFPHCGSCAVKFGQLPLSHLTWAASSHCAFHARVHPVQLPTRTEGIFVMPLERIEILSTYM